MATRTYLFVRQEPHLKHAIARTIGSLLLGLGMALSAAAQTVEGEVRKIDPDAGKITL
jgi:Cu/Ag efflux protein CusF